MNVRLLGPCFKTGRLIPFYQHPKTSMKLQPWIRTKYLRQTASCWPKAKDWQSANPKWCCDPQSRPPNHLEAITCPKALPSPRLYSASQNWCWPAKQKSTLLAEANSLISAGLFWCQTLPYWQFHVLFNSLFKVLCIFPSRYLYAIGLTQIFSLRWYLPPT